MTYNLTVIEKNGFLHVVVTGQNGKETVTQYLQAVYLECVARNCPRVLIEERLEGPLLETLDLFDVVSKGSRDGRKLKAVAYVNAQLSSELLRFSEHVAVNRGVAGRAFRTVDAAEEWLLQTIASAAEAPMPSDNSGTGDRTTSIS